MNGIRLTLSNDQAYDLVMSVATGALEDVSNIAAALQV
jgi:death-on-curing protein